MSEKITTGESNQDTSTRWDSLGDFAGERNINDATGKERTFSEFDLYPRMEGESTEDYGKRLKRMHEMTAEYLENEKKAEAEVDNPTEASETDEVVEVDEANEANEANEVNETNAAEIDPKNIANLSAEERAKLKDQYNKASAESIERQNKLLAEVEKEKARQAAYAEIIRNLEILEQLDNENSDTEPAVQEPELESEKSSMDKYAEMIEKRVASGDLTREEADAYLEKARLKNIPETVTEENSKWWADWKNNMSEDEWERYKAWSESKDEENLVNLAARDPELAKIQKDSLEERFGKTFDDDLIPEPESEPEDGSKDDSEDTPETGSEDAANADKAKRIAEIKEMIGEIDEDIEAIEDEIQEAEDERYNLTEYLIELMHKQGQSVTDQMITDSEAKLKKVNLPDDIEAAGAKVNTKQLEKMIEDNYDLIGDQEGANLLGSQLKDSATEDIYNGWWDSLSEDGRRKVAEIVDFAEKHNLLNSSANSPVNGAFLTWYHEFRNR